MVFEGEIGGIEKRFRMNIMRVDNVGWWFSGIVHCNPFCIGLICSPWGNLRRVHQEGRRKMKQGKVKSYRYGMRGEFTPDNHPKEGLFACLEGEVLEEHDEIFSGYNSVLFYSRRLTDEEKARYKLEEIE